MIAPLASLPIEERRALRYPLRLRVEVSGPGAEQITAQMVDLSVKGCRLLLPAAMRVGAFVTVAVNGFSSINGWVAWRRDDSTGVDFANPLPAPVVEHLLALGPAQQPLRLVR